jgi:NAD(P)-dependent dehydrogenase (short-subunit alcohol dehydrogenase family)
MDLMTSLTALVTGSSRGIGAAIAAGLKVRGARVIGHARSATHANIIAEDLNELGAAVRLWDQALALAGGQIDILINNAGLFSASPIMLSDSEWLDNWEETLRINLTAAAELSRLAVRHWLDRKAAGRVIHIASRAGYRGDSPEHWHYAAAKGGMIAMHKTIARHYAANGIMSYAICPGFTDTAMAGDYLASRGGASLLADIPLGRVATSQEIAAIATFCVFDAPESMTGAVIDANGASYVR